MRASPARIAMVLAALVIAPSDARADDLSSARALIQAARYEEAISLLEKSEGTADRRYQLARAMALLRHTNPCEALFDSVSATLASALESSPKLRRAARRDATFQEFHGTCVFQRLAYGVDVRQPGQLQVMLERVGWEGTVWAVGGPRDSLRVDKGKVSLSAVSIHDGCPIIGRYRLEGTTLHIEGVCSLPGRANVRVEFALTFDPEACTLRNGSEPIFADSPDECNV